MKVRKARNTVIRRNIKIFDSFHRQSGRFNRFVKTKKSILLAENRAKPSELAKIELGRFPFSGTIHKRLSSRLHKGSCEQKSG